MFPFVIAFLLGDVFLQSFAELPEKYSVVLAISVCTLFYYGLRNYFRYSYFPLAFVLGFAWSFWYATTILAFTLPKDIETKPVILTGYIASLPEQDNFGQHFLFSIETLQYQHYMNHQTTLVRLSWHNTEIKLHAGEEWQLLARLKRPHSTQNPNSFDYEAWNFKQGVRAVGYVVTSAENKLLSRYWYHYSLTQLRQWLKEKIQTLLPSSTTSPWLMALMLGERNNIPLADWQVLRNTGTNHLMAIAGLHIGIAAAITQVIVAWCWNRFPVLILCMPTRLVAAAAALVVAIIYSAIAGFSLPTERACTMLAIFIFCLLLKRKTLIWQPWLLTLFIVLVLNPLDVLSESFWLSFSTIALIIYGMQSRLKIQTKWWQWGRIQWILALGLLPITLLFFQTFSLVAFFANAIAIPWLTFLILPFCLFSLLFLLFLPSIAKIFLQLADTSIEGLWVILTWFSHLPYATLTFSFPTYTIALSTMVGIIILLLPRSAPGKLLSIFWLLPLVFYHANQPKFGEMWLTLLDVGQGLSAIVRTQNHILIYDTGAKLGDQFDMGEKVILPYLHHINIKKIDMLVISHGDNDHLGGAASLRAALPITEIKTSVPDKVKGANLCLDNFSWQWDGINFAFIYPSINDLNQGNNSSCVLRIDDGLQQILLTGDIEKEAEANLLAKHTASLPATVLIAPHHGSKTSSVNNFIDRVHPQYVLYPTGYCNRFHFPHPSVVAAYEKINSNQLNTALQGAIFIKFSKNKNPDIDLYRQTHKHYWWD